MTTKHVLKSITENFPVRFIPYTNLIKHKEYSTHNREAREAHAESFKISKTDDQKASLGKKRKRERRNRDSVTSIVDDLQTLKKIQSSPNQIHAGNRSPISLAYPGFYIYSLADKRFFLGSRVKVADS